MMIFCVVMFDGFGLHLQQLFSLDQQQLLLITFSTSSVLVQLELIKAEVFVRDHLKMSPNVGKLV